MAIVSPYLSVISYIKLIIININGLNSPIRRHILAEWIKNKQTKPQLMISVRHFTLYLRTHTDLTCKDRKNIPCKQ